VANKWVILPMQEVSSQAWAVAAVNYLQIFEHLDDFSRGIIDTRPFFYYASITFLLLGLSTIVIESKA
jgi:ABC-2 type transport system permease protein